MLNFLDIVHQTYSSAPGVGIVVLQPAGSATFTANAGGVVVDPFFAYRYSKYSPAVASDPLVPASPLVLLQV